MAKKNDVDEPLPDVQGITATVEFFDRMAAQYSGIVVAAERLREILPIIGHINELCQQRDKANEGAVLAEAHFADMQVKVEACKVEEKTIIFNAEQAAKETAVAAGLKAEAIVNEAKGNADIIRADALSSITTEVAKGQKQLNALQDRLAKAALDLVAVEKDLAAKTSDVSAIEAKAAQIKEQLAKMLG